MEFIDPISLDSTGLVQDGTTNKFKYDFNPSTRFEKSSIAVQSITMNYSWANFNRIIYNNTQFQLIFPTAATNDTISITVPDSFLDIAGLNSYLQSVMIANNLYLYDTASAKNVYYFEIQTNPALYAIQINTFLIPTALTGTLTYGSGGTWGSAGLPTVSRSPQIVVASNGFRDIIGFAAGTYPAVQTVASSTISTYTPQVSPVSVIKVLCSAVSNKYTQPNSFLISIPISNVSNGSIIDFRPPEYSYVGLQDQSLSEMTITFTDQNNRPIPMRDTVVVINLLLKSKK